jgi:hypothetical protein
VRAQRENHRDPDLGELRSAFNPLLDRVRDNVEAVEHLHLDARKPSWTATGVEVSEGQEVSVFATGRLWRSRPRDLRLASSRGVTDVT